MQYEDNQSDSLPSRDEREDGDMPPPKRRRRIDHNADSSNSREVGVMRDGTSFVGSASGIHFIRSVYNAMGTSSAETPSSVVANLVPGEDDRLASGVNATGPKSIWFDHEVVVTLESTRFSFENYIMWTASYFDVWHPLFPFLHAPTVLEIFEKAAQNGLTDLDRSDVVMIKSLVSLSLADRRQSQEAPLASIPIILLFVTFDESLECVQIALTQPATIKALQAVTCVQLFLISMLRLNAASRLGGLIVQMAFQLGLHRCPVRFEAFSHEEAQLRKRLFWSIYCLERYLCQALGLPLLIRGEDVDVCYLNKELHDPSKEQLSGANHPSSSKHDDRLQLLAFLTQHAQLRGAIIELRNKKVQERDRNPDAAVLISARLTQWWNSVEDFLDQQTTDATAVSNLHRAILEVLKYESVIMLNRPILALRKDSANYSAAIHTCIGAAKSILTTLTLLLQPMDVSTAQTLPMMWPSFTWATWMSAFIMFYASAEGKIDASVASRNIDKSLNLLKSLGKRGSVWPQACAVAIEDLRSNLKRQTGQSTDLDRRSAANARSTLFSGDVQSGRAVSDLYDSSDQPNGLNGLASDSAAILQEQRMPSTRNFRSENPSVTSEATYKLNPLHTLSGDSSTVPPNSSTNFNEDWSWQNLSFLSKAMPQMSPAGGDPLLGFDIPFWMGQDNYIAWMNDAV